MLNITNWVVRGFLTLAICVGLAVIVGCKRSPTTTSATATSAYDPDRYGIPRVLGHYEVLAVLADDNSPCRRAHEETLIVRPVSDLNRSGSIEELTQELRKHTVPNIADITWQFVDATTNRTELIDRIETINGQMRGIVQYRGSCPRTGVPISPTETLTQTPTPTHG